MAKTGESYTTARAHLLEKDPSPSPPLPEGYLDLAGMSDEAVEAKTGRSWPAWVGALDALGAVEMPHRDIARALKDDFGLSAWWSQTVTVAYERIRGLREVGQRRGGGYEANKTKTIHVPVATLYRAFDDEAEREKWLPGADLELRTVNENRSVRALWSDGTPVDFQFIDKGEAKSALNVQHRKLPDEETREERKAFWGERLEALAELLAPGG